MATDLNKVILIGRLTRDLGSNEYDFAYLSNGTAKAVVSIAVNRSVRRGEEWVNDVSYFDVTIWGKTAENLKPYLMKGKQIAVEGYLKQDRWEKEGQRFSKITVIAESVQLLGGKSESDGNNNGNYQNNANGYQSNTGYQNNAVSQNTFKPVNNQPMQQFEQENDFGFTEDIPF